MFINYISARTVIRLVYMHTDLIYTGPIPVSLSQLWHIAFLLALTQSLLKYSSHLSPPEMEIATFSMITLSH